jgi:type III polyketide synthase
VETVNRLTTYHRLRKLLAINKKTGIQTRASVLDFKQGFATDPQPPNLTDLDEHFRDVGVDLATQACRKALQEAGIAPEDITHTVAVTCTNQGNPGYNLLVHENLNLRPNIDHILLHGIGCAGGLSIMRTAAQMALASTARGRPARVLAFACELCTPNVRSELAAAEKSSAGDVCVAAALFSDGAAAFVLTNGIGKGDRRGIFQLGAFGNAVVPDTMGHMSFFVDEFGKWSSSTAEAMDLTRSTGTRTVLSRAIPRYTTKAVRRMFDKLVPEYSADFGIEFLEPIDFDWVLHPGGNSIIEGVKTSMSLSDEHLRATSEIYRTRGNSSSPTVLIVLDMLRSMGLGREHVVAASFGPGLSIEMVMLKRCRS